MTGFSLVELLIAVSILATVALAAAGVATMMSKANDYSEYKNEQQALAQIILGNLSHSNNCRDALNGQTVDQTLIQQKSTVGGWPITLTIPNIKSNADMLGTTIHDTSLLPMRKLKVRSLRFADSVTIKGSPGIPSTYLASLILGTDEINGKAQKEILVGTFTIATDAAGVIQSCQSTTNSAYSQTCQDMGCIYNAAAVAPAPACSCLRAQVVCAAPGYLPVAFSADGLPDCRPVGGQVQCPAGEFLVGVGVDWYKCGPLPSTTPTPTPVPSPTAGVCGGANGGTFADSTSATTAGLCSTGAASPASISGAGPWSWTCLGTSGGANASCTATQAPACAWVQISDVNPVRYQNVAELLRYAFPQARACTVAANCSQYGGGSGPLAGDPCGPSGATQNCFESLCGPSYGPHSWSCQCGGPPPPTPTPSGNCTTQASGPNPGVWAKRSGATLGLTTLISPIQWQTLTTWVEWNGSTGAIAVAGTACGNKGDYCNGMVSPPMQPDLTVYLVCEAGVPAAPPVVNGSCGGANGGTFADSTAATGAGLCSVGAASPSSLSGAGPWSWSCAGSGGGTNASCSASQSAPPPPSNLCWAPITTASGRPACTYPGPTSSSCAVSGAMCDAGPTGFICQTCGGPPPAVVNGSCGGANGGTFADSTAATGAGLCSAGAASPSSLSGAGPWSWSCAGSGGGSTASCNASQSAPPSGYTPPAGCGFWRFRALAVANICMNSGDVGTGENGAGCQGMEYDAGVPDRTCNGSAVGWCVPCGPGSVTGVSCTINPCKATDGPPP